MMAGCGHEKNKVFSFFLLFYFSTFSFFLFFIEHTTAILQLPDVF